MPKKIGDLVLYSTQELAEELEITTNTIRTYIKEGRIYGQKLGGNWYVSADSLQDFFKRPMGSKVTEEKVTAENEKE